jgi:hypothetical protein
MSSLPTLYTFVDEAGDFRFDPHGSEYFTVCAVTTRSVEIAHRLLDLRHELALAGTDVEAFHATEDLQAVRDRVFPLIQAAPLDIDAVVLHKRKTEPRIARNHGYFYQLAWWLLFKYIAPRRCGSEDDLLVAASSLETHEKKARFKWAIEDVIQQHSVCRSCKVGFWPAASHPCLQVADYCAWAIHRWAERGDKRSFALIEPQVRSVFWPFAGSTKEYY